MIQDWDRLVMIGVGLGVSLYTGIQGWQFWRRRNRWAALGAALLALVAGGLPVALVLLAT